MKINKKYNSIMTDSITAVVAQGRMGPLLLTWFNFNRSMDK